jgi:hypothetical protein
MHDKQHHCTRRIFFGLSHDDDNGEDDDEEEDLPLPVETNSEAVMDFSCCNLCMVSIPPIVV